MNSPTRAQTTRVASFGPVSLSPSSWTPNNVDRTWKVIQNISLNEKKNTEKKKKTHRCVVVVVMGGGRRMLMGGGGSRVLTRWRVVPVPLRCWVVCDLTYLDDACRLHK
jgi:hypothetical protein